MPIDDAIKLAKEETKKRNELEIEYTNSLKKMTRKNKITLIGSMAMGRL